MVNWLLHWVAVVSWEKLALRQQQLRPLPQQYLRCCKSLSSQKNSQQRQNKIDQQASKISSLEAQNQKLTQLPEPKFLVDTITKAVASNLNINVGNKLQKGDTDGTTGYTGKPYMGKPRPLKLAPGD